ncbi:MAG: hypothetical protein CMO80_03670 [Verrucomicrobiales bacterium]|nr:hypothetical protein [Verrucomicrobiales bacterium]|tara:strand:+ start:24615 stop:25946 length:1332 start_codon:yes stop_codon:yes gene_type:complete
MNTPRLISLTALLALCARGDNWPSFRGVDGHGIGTGSPPTTWNIKSGENISWKVEIEGLSISSPIIWGDQVFMTTAVGTDPNPEFKHDPTWGYRILREKDEQEWKLICLDKNSGKRLWEKVSFRGKPRQGRHSESTYANPTPVTDGTNVVAMFGSQGIYCYTLEGKLKWKKDLGALIGAPSNNQKLDWGYSSSPIIHRGEVILQCDNPRNGYVLVLNVENGKDRLRFARRGTATWATPSVATHDGRDLILCNGYKNAGAYDLKTGRVIWTFEGRGDIPVPRPLVSDGLVFITAAHGGRSLHAVDLGAEGDITPTPGDSKLPKGMRWWSGRQGSYIPTPLIHEGILYVCNERGLVSAFEAKTGKSIYQSRIVPGRGAMAYSSPVLAGGHIYVPNNEGKVHVLAAGRKFRHVGTIDMKEQIMASPAVSEEKLYLRTRRFLYCIGN